MAPSLKLPGQAITIIIVGQIANAPINLAIIKLPAILGDINPIKVRKVQYLEALTLTIIITWLTLVPNDYKEEALLEIQGIFLI